MQLTHEHALAIARDLYPGKVVAFVATIDNGLGLAILGESGYRPFASAISHPDYETASAAAAKLNEALGWDSNTAIAIVADTMRRSERERERREGVTAIKLSREEAGRLVQALDESDYDGDYDGLREKLTDAYDEFAATEGERYPA